MHTAKLLDYGLAKAMDAGPGGQTTTLGPKTVVTGGFVGSPPYMSAEALEGRYGAQSEVYSFGVVLLDFVTAGTKEEIKDATDDGGDHKGLQGGLDPAAADWPEDVVDPLLALTNSCLRRRPAHRPQTMREVLLALTHLHNSLLLHRGEIPCPGFDAGGGRCGSQAWEVAHLLPHLEQQTQVRRSNGPFGRVKLAGFFQLGLLSSPLP